MTTAAAQERAVPLPGLAADFQGPVGNHSDKYAARNPAVRKLVERFLGCVDDMVRELRPATLLDVGCGEGVVAERIARNARGTAVVGVDLGEERLAPEWRSRAGANLSFQSGSAYGLEFPDASFDVVTAFEVLEHLDDPARALGELTRVARRAVVASVPWEPAWRIVHLLAGRDVRRLGNTPGHVNHWTRRGFCRFAGRYGAIDTVRRPFPWTMVVVTRTTTSA